MTAPERRADPSGLPAAELHLHLYGCLRAEAVLEHLAARATAGRPAELSWYQDAHEAAYGERPDVHAIVDRHRAGDESAAGEFAALFAFADADAGDFDRFQAKFNLLTAASTLRDGDLEATRTELDRYLDAILHDHHRRGIAHAEHRLRLGPGLDEPVERAFLAQVLDRFDRAEQVEARLAVSLWREDPWAGWDRVQELALGPHGHVLTGIDFCHVEEGHPPKAVAEFFAAVHEFNDRHPDRALAILHHVGESFRDKSLESAVRWVREAAELGAHRLGHAIALGLDPAALGPHERTELVSERLDQLHDDLSMADELARFGLVVDPVATATEIAELGRRRPDERVTLAYDGARLAEVRRRQDHAMDRIARTGAVVEVCPTSNRRIGAILDPAHHPVHRFLAAGLPVVVSSDDPGLFGVDLHHELDWVVTHAGADRDELLATAWRSRSEVLTGRVR